MFARNQGGRNGQGKVCEFFLQGRCKFGDNCKFVHPADNNSNNRFNALSGNQQGRANGQSNQNGRDVPYLLSKDNIVVDLKEERPIWPFSAYGPGKDAPRQLFGGAPLEQSPEEMRVMFYQAQAAGNPQTAVQAEQQLLQQMNDQVQKILNDPQGALQYVLAGDNEHPNRRDMTVVPGTNNPFRQNTTGSAFGQPSNSSASPFGGASAFGQPSQPGSYSGFGQPSSLGAKPAFGQASQPSAFGQPSAMGGASAFGQPSQSGTSSPFGRPSQSGTGSAFGQPSQPGGGSAFGQPSQPGSGSAFGQPSQPGPGSAFGQPSQPGTSSAFGKPSAFGGASAFGAPSSLGGSGAFGQASNSNQSTSAFGQPSQPSNPFSNQQSSSPFGQGAPAPQASPFGNGQTQQGSAFGQASQSTSSPFGGAAQNQASPFGGAQQSNPSPFGQPAQPFSSPFSQGAQQQSQNQANTSAVKAPFAGSHAHPQSNMGSNGPTNNVSSDTATPPLSTYAQHAGNQLRSWRGNAVTYVDGAPHYSRTGNLNDPKSLEKIWFPDGAPGPNPYTVEAEELYAKYGGSSEAAYRTCAEQGAFAGAVPLLAPTRAWTRYDM